MLMTHPAIFFLFNQCFYDAAMDVLNKTAGKRVTSVITVQNQNSIAESFLSAALGLLCLKILWTDSFSCC